MMRKIKSGNENKLADNSVVLQFIFRWKWIRALFRIVEGLFGLGVSGMATFLNRAKVDEAALILRTEKRPSVFTESTIVEIGIRLCVGPFDVFVGGFAGDQVSVIAPQTADREQDKESVYGQ
eukprot:19451_2